MTTPNAKPRAGEHTRWEAERSAVVIRNGGGGKTVIADCDSYERARLIASLPDIIEERDLARLHDSQPYPTAAAYEALCKAHNALAAQNRELVQALELIASGADGPRTAREALGKVWNGR